MRASSPAAWTRTPTCMSLPRLTRSAGCWACRSSRLPQPGTPACWAGCAVSGPSPWPASKGPAATARAWPAIWPRPGCVSWKWTAPTARTGPGRASPTRWMRSARRGGGDPGADGRQAQRPPGADPGDQPGPGADHDRPGGAAGPVRPALPGAADSGDRGAAAPARRRARVRDPGRAARASPPRLVPGAQLDRLDELTGPLVTARAPGLLALHGVGPDTAALLLVAAGDHPERLRSESSRAHLGGVAPIPASSGKTAGRYRLNRGGNREASQALWRIVITRMSSHPATRAYAARRSEEGLSKKEIIRCLKRYVAREVYRQLRDGA